MKRTTIGILAGTVLLVGCQDLGLDYNMPLDEAMAKEPYPLVSAVMSPVETADRRLIVEGTMWIPSGLPINLRTEELRSIGSSGGETVYARSWDEAPYDALFTRLEEEIRINPRKLLPQEGDQYLEFRPVIGGGMTPGTRPSTKKEDGGH